MGHNPQKDRENYYQHMDLDELGVSQEDGRFDLSDTQTSFLGDQGLSEDQMESIETQFIDDLYGTTGGQTIIDGKNVEHTQGQWQSTTYDDEGALAQEGVDTTLWGLDLRRTMLDEDGGVITSSHPEYYEHLTRGEVDWASYQDDPKYVEAFNKMAGDLGPEGKHVKLDELTDDKYTDEQRAEFIRKATIEIDTPWKPEMGDNKGKDHEEWEGKIDKNKIFRDKENNLFIDGQKQQTLKDLWANDKGRLTVDAPGEHTAILKRRKIGRPDIPGIKWTPTGRGWDRPSLTNPVKPKLPGNIPRAWVTKGAIKK